ncbi:MAG TPA: hypothetical protein VN238_13325 [Solirubrobacteraceae bacterium]|nr:hypothetical protein [Solirubrobacteraceae bacterium]
MRTTADTHPLTRLAEDIHAAAFLLEPADPLRGYLVMLASLPAEAGAWEEILTPWLDDLRHGEGPAVTAREHLAAFGALGVAALRAARELDGDPALAAGLRSAARWCFWLVKPDRGRA